MSHADFVHLRVHSAYSLSEGAIKADKIPALARDARDARGRHHRHRQPVRRAGVLPGLRRQGHPADHRLPGRARPRRQRRACRPTRWCCWRRTRPGLANLQRLSSRGFLETEPGLKPQVPLATLAAHAEGLILLTGGTTGPLARLLAEGQKRRGGPPARRAGRGLPRPRGDGAASPRRRRWSRAVEPGLIALADAAGLPLVATNDCYFARPEMHEAHDALLCIAEGRLLADPERRRSRREHWFKPAADMRVLFADLPDACDNTLAIARRCAVMAETSKPLLPRCPKVRPGQTEEETVRAMAAEGLARRLDAMGADAATRARYAERLDYELGVIAQMGFAGYFLIVADFIQWAKAHGIPVGPGRGSGAGSVAAWALTITDLDPLRFDLLFERFLNPERVSMPDFDIDFCQEGRDRVIDYVRQEYGADRVAQIITFGKLQARAAVRDVGRVLGLPFGQVNKIAELIPNNPAKPVTLARRSTASRGCSRCATTTRRCAGCWRSRCRSRVCIATPPPTPPAW